NTGSWGFTINDLGADENILAFWCAHDTGVMRRSNDNVYSSNTWHHVAMAWDGNYLEESVKFYVDGVEVAGYKDFAIWSDNLGSDSAQNLYIGSDGTGDNTFDGMIDNVMIFDRVLNSTEIASLYSIEEPNYFTIVALPDTQFYSQSYPAIFSDQTQWVVDNKDALNIVYVAHEGDVVNSASSTSEWDNTDDAMSLLEDPVTTELADGIPYGIAPGNHDEPTTNFNLFFGSSRFSGRGYYGGHYGSNNDNSYMLFSAGGMNFVVVNLEYQPGSTIISWADGILKAYSGRRAIVVSHELLDTGGNFRTSGQAIYDGLKDNPNLFLMLCGHMHGEARRTDTYNGNTVHTLLADYQDEPSGGNGWLRILEFSPDDNEIYVKTYSPWLDQWDTGASSQFTLSYEMQPDSTPVEFTAYNDMAWGTGQLETNITKIASPNGGSGLPSSGMLVKYSNGSSTGITLTVTGGNYVTANATQGSEPTSGTDAYNHFNGKLNCLGAISYVNSAPPAGNLVLTLTEMDPNKTYNLSYYANRGSYDWDRASLITISGADAFTNSSSAATDNPTGTGGTIFDGPTDSSTRLPADNSTRGYIAYFTDVDPGSDGQLILTISFDGTGGNEYLGKYASALMVQQLGFDTPPEPTQPAFRAYIDLNATSGGNHANVLGIVPTGPDTQPIDPATDWVLKDFDTGAALPITMWVDMDVRYPTTNGGDPNPGTDAYNLFSGVVNGQDGYEIDEPNGHYVTVTFENMDPNAEYVIACTYDRQKLSEPYTDRASQITISGADTYTNASSTGVVVNSPDSVSFTTGDNTTTGYVAKWTNVTAADGSFSITTVQDNTPPWTGSKGYAVTSFLLEGNVEPPEANDVDFTAYIDLNSQSGDDNYSNVLALEPTTIGEPWTPPLLDPCQGLVLIDYDTGANLPVTMSVDLDVRYATDNGADSDPGTDADLLFGGIVDGVGGYEIDEPNGHYLKVTFDGLDPNKEYLIAMTYNRDNVAYTDRATKFTILGADTYTQASSPGVVVNSGDSVSFCTGDNTANGYVGRWTSVTAADGSFSVISEQDKSAAHGWDTGSKGYAMTSVMLQQSGDASSQMVQCAVFGDYYNASAKTQAVANLVDSWNVDFIFTTGDNTGPNPIDTDIGQFYSDYIGSYIGSYGSGSATNRFFPTLGNHDNDDGGGLPEYLAYFTLPGAGIASSNTSGNERYYDFIWGPVHVFVINSEFTPPIDPDGRTSSSIQGQWLQAQLAASTAPWKLVTFHHPPYTSTSGKLNDVEMQWPFQQWGATAVFCGHNHGYERIMKNGFPYIVSAAGGRPLYEFGTPEPGSVVRYNNDNGAMLIKASNTSITFEFWSLNTSDGNNGLIDTYTIGAPTSEGFTAYNDTAWVLGQVESNITKITSPTGGSGLPNNGELINFATGAGTGITLTVTGGSYDGDSGGQGGHGDSTMAGDALSFFGGKLNPLGTVSYIDAAGSNLVFTLTGMDPNDRYELVHYAHRNGSSIYDWQRAAWATISGADSFTNSSTAGLDNNSNPLFSGPSDPNTKYPANNASGRVVRYTNIDPGSDGEIVLTMSYAGENEDGSPGLAAYKGKYSNALMLRGTMQAEEPNELQELPILLGDSWRYFKGTVEPPSGWKDPNFDDSSWLKGPTGIGYGDTDDATVLSDMQNNYISVYARKDFNVPEPNEVYRLLFSMDYDDGFVAYLNGTEIARANVNGNPPAYDMNSITDHEASGGHPSYAEPVEYFEVDESLLQPGRNTFAFQGHNESLSSSDFSMLPALEDVNCNWISYINLNAKNPADQTDPGALRLNPEDADYTSTAYVLKDFDTDVNLPVTISIDMDIRYPTENGANCDTGTDADDIFGEIIDLSGGMEIDEPNGHYLTTTFDNLNPDKKYTIALTYNRRDTSGYLDRSSRFTITGADTYTQASSSGVVINSPNSVSFCTGYNKENGYVAQWTDVIADDGSFSVTAEQDKNATYGWDTGSKGYTMTAIMLLELDHDSDSDGIPDDQDNCPDVNNPGQEDIDGDGVGDLCDNCPTVSNSDQNDVDTDEVGDKCDNCPETNNTGQSDFDEDGIGDLCECYQSNIDAVNPVNFSDFARLAFNWLESESEGDTNWDGIVDAIDLAQVAQHWLEDCSY
ncbi:MAG: metallophosphoesterase, partial [Sedimentisphaerales bacterium]|nr:metallophosphoesterase [Sedimentisphaerales bacterium]